MVVCIVSIKMCTMHSRANRCTKTGWDNTVFYVWVKGAFKSIFCWKNISAYNLCSSGEIKSIVVSLICCTDSGAHISIKKQNYILSLFLSSPVQNLTQKSFSLVQFTFLSYVGSKSNILSSYILLSSDSLKMGRFGFSLSASMKKTSSPSTTTSRLRSVAVLLLFCFFRCTLWRLCSQSKHFEWYLASNACMSASESFPRRTLVLKSHGIFMNSFINGKCASTEQSFTGIITTVGKNDVASFQDSDQTSCEFLLDFHCVLHHSHVYWLPSMLAPLSDCQLSPWVEQSL